jgi:hypothetical protein
MVAASPHRRLRRAMRAYRKNSAYRGGRRTTKMTARRVALRAGMTTTMTVTIAMTGMIPMIGGPDDVEAGATAKGRIAAVWC